MHGHEVPVPEAIRGSVPLSFSQKHSISAWNQRDGSIYSFVLSVACLCLCIFFLALLTGWGGECDVQVPSSGVLDAGLHLHVFQWADCVLLPSTGFGWNLYSDLPCCFQLPVGCIKIARNETHKQLSMTTESNASSMHFPDTFSVDLEMCKQIYNVQ